MSDRTGQVWEMGNSVLFLVTRPPISARQLLREAGSPMADDKRRKRLDTTLWHPILFLETGREGGLSEEKPGYWESDYKTWVRHS